MGAGKVSRCMRSTIACGVQALDRGMLQSSVVQVSQSRPNKYRLRRRAHLRRVILVQVATANVSTLWPKELRGLGGAYGVEMLSRVAMLERQFDSRGMALVGLQETRLQKSGQADGSVYCIVSAPANGKGVGGVQIWVRRSWIMERPCITHTSSQVLAAKLRLSDGTSLGLVCGHAPIECESGMRKDAWWDELDQATVALRSSMPNGSPVLCLLDANAHVGSVASPCFGDEGKDKENDNGSRLRSFLEGQQQVARMLPLVHLAFRRIKFVVCVRLQFS